MASVKEADGQITQYGYDYDSSKRLFYVLRTHPGGTAEERWFDPAGQMLRQDLDGQTRVSVSSGLRERTRWDAAGVKTVDSFDEWKP